MSRSMLEILDSLEAATKDFGDYVNSKIDSDSLDLTDLNIWHKQGLCSLYHKEFELSPEDPGEHSEEAIRYLNYCGDYKEIVKNIQADQED